MISENFPKEIPKNYTKEPMNVRILYSIDVDKK